MFKRTIFTFLTLPFLPFFGIGQSLPFNQYGNEIWLGDSINGLPAPNRFGFNYRPDNNLPPKLRLTLPITSSDSNTYSRMLYRITNAQNQSLGARVYRPLGEGEFIDFNLQRISNNGWMVQSESRFTYADVRLLLDVIDEKLTLDLSGDATILDRDQNGGLKSDAYDIATDAGPFGALANDVFLTTAFNRSTDYKGRMALKYSLNERLAFSGIGQVKQQRYLYDDNDGDRPYYDAFRDDTNNVAVRDSNNVFIWGTGGSASYLISEDSIKRQAIEITLMHNAIRYRSMEPTAFTTNTSVQAAFESVGLRNTIRLLGRSGIAGYNEGDFLVKGSWDRLLNGVTESDSLASGQWHLLLKVNAQRYAPYGAYSRYQSNFLSWNLNLSKSNAIDFDGGIEHQGERGRFGFMLNSDYRENFVFLNDVLEVEQANKAIAVAGVELMGDYTFRRFDLSGIARYQLNVFDLVYDLPMFSTAVEVSYSFPVFNKAIYLKTGTGITYFTDYRARAYAPFMDMYYLQRSERFGNYLQVDPFIQASIQSVDVSFRFLNATYGLLGIEPLVGPRYPSVPRYFEVRIDWIFKN
ncbi:MAG: hypothetical protein HQ500_11595 [Flavobacteriales bacterium]|nr:hypothetical protein [Flavobacteriales bacterium]